MSRRCAVVWLAVLGVAVSSPTRAAEPALRAGDLVFETSSSSQSWAIRWATRSPWSHVGIVDVGDDRIYCSELVVKAYERAAGVSFGRRERLADLRIVGLRGAIERRWGGPVPEDLVLVTPASITEDGRLERVYEGRP